MDDVKGSKDNAGENFSDKPGKELRRETINSQVEGDKESLKVESPSVGKELNNEFVRGKLDAMTEYIDKHIRWYRLIPTIATSGALVFLIYYFHVPIRKIKNGTHLSNALILRNKTLSGVVKSTGHDSIGVWHIPGWRRITRIGTKPQEQCPPDQLLSVGFSGLYIQDKMAASVWLKQCMLGQTVRVKLMSHSTSDDRVDCMVYYKKAGRMKKKTICLNEELLRLGVATVTEIQGDFANSDYAKITAALLKAEGNAKRKGVGVWTGTDHVTLWNRFKFFWKKNS